MQDKLLRAVYGVEFLIAVVAALQFWSYVGGQNHLDYVPWVWKGLLPIGVATAAVGITHAESLQRAGRWFVLLLVLMTACGLLSYYAHVSEPQDEGDDPVETVPTSLKV